MDSSLDQVTSKYKHGLRSHQVSTKYKHRLRYQPSIDKVQARTALSHSPTCSLPRDSSRATTRLSLSSVWRSRFNRKPLTATPAPFMARFCSTPDSSGALSPPVAQQCAVACGCFVHNDTSLMPRSHPCVLYDSHESAIAPGPACSCLFLFWVAFAKG